MLRKNTSKPPNLDASNRSMKRRKTKNKDAAPGSKNVEAVDHGPKKNSKRRSSDRKKKNIDLDESVKKPTKKKRASSRRKKHESLNDSEKKKRGSKEKGSKEKGSKADRKKKRNDDSPKKEKEKEKEKDKDKDVDGSERRVKKEKGDGSMKERKGDSERVVRKKEDKDKDKDKDKEKDHKDKDKDKEKEKEKDKDASERNKKSPPHINATPPIGSASSQPVSNPTKSPNQPDPQAGTSTPGATPPNAPGTPNQQVVEDDSDDEEESSGGKTPPNTPEPNEGPSEAAAEDAAAKSQDLAAKGDVLTVGGIKLLVQEPLKGSYGMGIALTKEVDKKIDIISAGAQVNLKYERHGAKIKKLMIETEIIKHAHANQKPCVPVYIESGEHNHFNCLIVDGMGPSLGELVEKLNGFSPPTIFKIALITIDLLRIFHSMLYLHRDIRPHIFHVGKEGHRNRIIIGAITCARKYGIRKEVEPEEKCDLEIRKPKFRTKVWHPRKKVLFIGSVKYAPRSSHLNKEHTRRDDVESWFYMIYEFLNKSLPWKNMTDKEKIYEAKNEFLQDQKFSDDVQRKYGPEMVNICEYFGVQNYYEMEPDYTYIELCVLNLLKDANKNNQNDKFDWEQQPAVFNSSAPPPASPAAVTPEKDKTPEKTPEKEKAKT